MQLVISLTSLQVAFVLSDFIYFEDHVCFNKDTTTYYLPKDVDFHDESIGALYNKLSTNYYPLSKQIWSDKHSVKFEKHQLLEQPDATIITQDDCSTNAETKSIVCKRSAFRQSTGETQKIQKITLEERNTLIEEESKLDSRDILIQKLHAESRGQMAFYTNDIIMMKILAVIITSQATLLLGDLIIVKDLSYFEHHGCFGNDNTTTFYLSKPAEFTHERIARFFNSIAAQEGVVLHWSDKLSVKFDLHYFVEDVGVKMITHHNCRADTVTESITCGCSVYQPTDEDTVLNLTPEERKKLEEEEIILKIEEQIAHYGGVGVFLALNVFFGAVYIYVPLTIYIAVRSVKQKKLK